MLLHLYFDQKTFVLLCRLFFRSEISHLYCRRQEQTRGRKRAAALLCLTMYVRTWQITHIWLVCQNTVLHRYWAKSSIVSLVRNWMGLGWVLLLAKRFVWLPQHFMEHWSAAAQIHVLGTYLKFSATKQKQWIKNGCNTKCFGPFLRQTPVTCMDIQCLGRLSTFQNGGRSPDIRIFNT